MSWKRMKLASLDDLLAEIGLGNAMSVVVAKTCNRAKTSPHRRKAPLQAMVICRLKALTAFLITFAKCCRPIPWRPDYRPMSARQRHGHSTMSPAVTFAVIRKSQRSLWPSSGIKRPRAGIYHRN